MIGKIEFTIDNRTYVATLAEDGQWTFAPDLPAGLIDAHVRDVCQNASAAYTGPQDGPFGPAQLEAAAQQLGGTATLANRPDPPYGRVY